MWVIISERYNNDTKLIQLFHGMFEIVYKVRDK